LNRDGDAGTWPARSRVIRLHLAATVVAALAVTALYVFGWYPGVLFRAAGGGKLLAVHLALLFATGPLLTAVLYRPGKRGLRIDVWMTAILQVLALAGGVYAGYLVRPAYIAILPLRATLVRANETVPEPVPGADVPATSPWAPRVVAVDDPPTEEARSDMLMAVMAGAADIDYRPAYYRPVESRIDLLLEHATPLPRHLEAFPALSSTYEAWLSRHGLDATDDVRVYPMAGTDRDVEVVLDAASRRVVGYVLLP
jgi:hypothetical protein